MTKPSKYDKRLISANLKNRQNYDSQMHPSMNEVYSLNDKNWPQDLIDRARTHDDRNAEMINLEHSSSAMKVENDYATFTANKEDPSAAHSGPFLNYLKQDISSNKKPIMDSNVAVQRYVKMAPSKTINKKSIKSKSGIKNSKKQVKSF